MKHKKRQLCSCGLNPVAINYYKNGIPYYRSKCDKCSRLIKKKKISQKSNWSNSGYKMKNKCERCGFVPENSIQLSVYHIDMNKNNNNWRNLKTVCANCLRVLYVNKGWKQGHLMPDY